MLCPKCGSTDLGISRRGGFRPTVLSWFNIPYYKCRACRGRFHWPVRPTDEAARRKDGYTAPAVRIAEATPPTPKPVRPNTPKLHRFPAGAVLSKWAALAAIIAMVVLGVSRFYSDGASGARADFGFVLEQEVNRPGFDFAAFALKEPRPEMCAEHCRKDVSCNAFTFVKASVEGSAAMCYLKTAAAAPISDKLCVTGVKGR
jgi:hypothetical protein